MDFTEIIKNSGLTHDKRWLKRYEKFIEIFSLQKTIKNETHKHHILPRSLFPEFKDLKVYQWNKSILTYRAHYIAHYMLSKIFGGKMWIAFSLMNTYGFSSTLYRIGVENHSKSILGAGNPMYGKTHTDKTKQKMTDWQIGLTYIEKYGEEKALEMCENLKIMKTGMKYSDEVNKKKGKSGESNAMYGRKIPKEQHPMYGKKHTQETKDKMAKAKEGFIPWMKGKNHTQETKDKLSKARQGVPSPNKGTTAQKFPCLYCGKEMNSGNLTRWHNENCKQKGTM